MEEVFDLREFVLLLLRRWKPVLALFLALGILGAGYGFFLAGRVEESEDTFTATSAAAVNLEDGGQIPYWTPSGIMATVDAIAGSDFVYANFADHLLEQGLGAVFKGAEDPTVADIKLAARFYIRGNLLLADITTSDQELSQQASQAAIRYLADTLPGILNHISLVPQDRQTINITAQQAPSPLRKAVKYGALGGVGGAVAGVLWVFLFDVFDLRIRSERDLRRFGLPVLGVLPDAGKSAKTN